MMLLAAVLVGAAAGAALAAWFLTRAAAERERRTGRLLSFAMHELNTPATALNMTVINLLTGVFGDVPADQRRWLELTREQVARLNALIGELRDLVHLEIHDDLRPRAAATDAADVVDEAVAGLRGGFEHAGVELQVAPADGLPKALIDPERAARSLASLLFHARKFRVRGPVALRAAADGPSVVWEVTYEGQRLSPADAAASLDLWYPARERKDQLLAATGLGLGLVRGVLRRCGGDLELSVDETGRARLRMTAPAEGGA